jgi:hypothetical protein
VKTAEGYRNILDNESCPEVDGVSYMPEVYKISMVRMQCYTERYQLIADESPNVQV